MQKKEEYDFSKLVGRIKEKGYTQEMISGVISRNPCTFSQKSIIEGHLQRRKFPQCVGFLKLKSGNRGVFFTPKVQKVGIYL